VRGSAHERYIGKLEASPMSYMCTYDKAVRILYVCFYFIVFAKDI